MSLIAQVTAATGATRGDVLRVATHGGTTADDWAIAHAIQDLTGRNAYELMYTAGRDQMIDEIWGDTGAPVEAPAPTNPSAAYDPEVVIYRENTSPDETRQVVPHHPGDHDEVVEETQEQTADQLADTLLADLAEVLDDTPAAIRLTRAWSTPADAHQTVAFALEIAPRRWVRARYQARLQHHLATAA